MKITVGSTLLLCRCEWTEMKRKAAEQLIDDCQLGWWIRYMAETAWPFLVRLPRSFPLFLSAWLAVCFAVDVLLQKLEQTYCHSMNMLCNLTCQHGVAWLRFISCCSVNQTVAVSISNHHCCCCRYTINFIHVYIGKQASISNRATACSTKQIIWK